MRAARGLAAITAAITLSLGMASVQAQPYPARSIKIVVPATPGGAIDVIARLVGDKLTASMGQSAVIENKPGASNNLGTDFVAKSPPDGYSLVIVASSHATNKFLFKQMPFDPVTDFEPVVFTHIVPLVLAVHPVGPRQECSGTDRLDQGQPGQGLVRHSGKGSSLHMAAELFKSMAGITKMLHVPYRGSTAAHPDLLGGRTAMIFDTVTAIQPHVQSGGVRALAVTTTKRSVARRTCRRSPSRPVRLRRQHLGRHPGAGRHAQGYRRQAQCRDQQGACRRGRARQAGCGRDRHSGRHAGRVRRLHQGRGREVGQGDEGRRHPAGMKTVTASARSRMVAAATAVLAGGSPPSRCACSGRRPCTERSKSAAAPPARDRGSAP